LTKLAGARATLVCIALAAPATLVAGNTIDSLTDEQRVSVSGIVERITDEDTFILRDHTGSIEVYIGPNPMTVREGMSITVHGEVDVDVAEREIYANRIVKPGGEEQELSHKYD
jgi:uncharacterized protein YdeI (BOF family)